MFSYEKGNASISNRLNKEGILITNEFTLAKKFLIEVRTEIENNAYLREHLYPNNAENWGAVSLKCKNGASFQVKGSGSQIRGIHTGWAVLDDIMDDSCLYSEEQRKYIIELLNSVILNVVDKGGQVVVSGCVIANTLVLEKDKGFCPIIDLAPKNISLIEKKFHDSSDLILDSFGNFEKSIKFYVNGWGKTYKIELNNGLELEGSPIHPIWKFYNNGEEDWCKLPEIKIGDIVEIKDNLEVENWGQDQEIVLEEIKYCTKLNLPKFVNEEIAYLLGIYVAEGNLHNNRKQIQIHNNEVNFDFTEKYGLKFNQQHVIGRYVCSSKILWNWIESLGLNKKAGLKFIPEIILKGKKQNLKAFICGLMDGDGCGSKGNVSFNSSSETLIFQLKNILLMGFGIDTSISFHSKESINSNFKNKGVKITANYNSYNLVFSKFNSKLFFERIGFSIERKQKEYIFCNNSSYLDDYLPVPKQILINLKQKVYDKQNNQILNQIIRRDSKYLTINTFKQIIDNYDNLNIAEVDILKKYINKRWRVVTKIEESENYTYDFVIPKHNIFIGNGIKNHQTVFHQEDLFGYLKKTSGWRVFEYPAIFPNGELLWPEKYVIEDLQKKREQQGAIIFSREILCKPITDGTSIFPRSALERSFIGMDNHTIVHNRYSHPIKFKKVSVGCDFAISSTIGSDFSVFTVTGLDEHGFMWLLYRWRKQGASYNEQISVIKEINNSFTPDIIMCEDNNFQRIFIQMLVDAGLDNVVPHTTGNNKYDLKSGLPAMAVIFEQGRMKFPRGDQESKDITDSICSEFNGITFVNNKLENIHGHDDQAMSLWLSVRGIHYVNQFILLDFI